MLLQLIVNGIIAGIVYALIALGFVLIYATSRIFHFAHGAVYTAGAYLAYMFSVQFGFPFPLGALLSIFFATLLGIAVEVIVYRPLRTQNASALVVLLSSLGTLIFLQNLIALIFGNDTKVLRSGIIREGYHIGGITITHIQVGTFFISLLLILLFQAFLQKTKMGKSMQAIADDMELAKVVGIDTDRILVYTYAIGSALAAIAAILISFDRDMHPTMGMNAVLMGAVAAIIGGKGGVLGAAIGGLLLGLTQHAATWQISSKWQDFIAFLLLLLFLIYKPTGLFGKQKLTSEI